MSIDKDAHIQEVKNPQKLITIREHDDQKSPNFFLKYWWLILIVAGIVVLWLCFRKK
ncbi:MAG: hypothetical protein ACOC4M_11160 [Promethearchaeia archaeon]